MGTSPTDYNYVDDITIRSIIGDKWLYDSKLYATNAIAYDGRPLPAGAMTYYIRERLLQDTKGQVIAPDGSFATQQKTQTRIAHPRLNRGNSVTFYDLLEAIEVKDVEKNNVDVAGEISKAAGQYLDDALISVLKGVSAALTTNQHDGTAAVIDLTQIVKTYAKLGERGVDLYGGLLFHRSEVHWKMVELGLVAQTANTFGNANQEAMVKSGKLPMQTLGLTPIITDKLESLGSNQYYLYLVAPGAMMVRGATAPFVESARLTANRQLGTVTNFNLSFGVGIYGMGWGATSSLTLEDTDLETSANWSLAVPAGNQVPIARLKTKTA